MCKCCGGITIYHSEGKGKLNKEGLCERCAVDEYFRSKNR